MTDKTKRINIWSGPRNISTALMYSFAQRSDTQVYDEPLYAHYLSKTPAKDYHPGAAEVIADQENDGKKVIEMIMGTHSKPVAFFKHMTHHLIELDFGFLHKTTNVILTRDPREMLPSFINQIKQPQLKDTGYAAHIKLLNYLKINNLPIIVLDGKNVLLNPEKVLTELCNQIDIPFQKSMLSWNAGARPEDGVWAKHWYHNVHKSTAFAEYRPKTEPFPERLKPLLAECLPLYKELSKLAIQP